MMVINKEMLQVSSVDPANTRGGDVIYTLVPSVGNPKQGEVIMVVPIPSTGAGRGWQELGDGLMAAKMYRFLQRDIDEGRIYYRNLRTGTTSDIFTFEVADTSVPPNILKGQRFQITIMDESIVEELSEPTLSPGVELGMTVLENQIVPITSENLAYVDSDTSPGDLIYRITTLLGEGEGTVENVDLPFQPVLRFSQTDIDSNKIIYRPPDTDIGMQEKDVIFSFVVTDGGRERRLPEQKFTIRIIPVNNLSPQFRIANPELTVAQGGSTPVGQVLQVSDGDSALESLTLTLVQEPSQGHLEKVDGGHKVVSQSGDIFHVHELSDSTLQYVHSGSDHPLVDEFYVLVSDGDHQVVTTVKLRILKTDKSAPYMLPSASCHLNVTEGELTALTTDILQFGDDDELDEGIVITLSSKPVQGRLLLKNKVVPVGGGFSQDDINNDRVSFKAEEEIGSQPITELLYFNVSDSSRNLLPNQVLSVFITPHDNQSPVVAVGPDIKVEEGGEVQLTRRTIQVLDIDSPLRKLFIHIDTPPSFGVILNKKPASGSEREQLRSVTSFSLNDLFSGHIYYSQKDHLNKEPAWDNVLFHVSDGTNDSPPQRLNISIVLVNDEPPHMITEQLFVSEGKSVLLTNASMYVVDLDTQPADLLFTLTLPPTQGYLKKKEFTADQAVMAETLKQGSTFSYQDILNELILYHHNDGDAMTDVFHLYISDGDFNESKSLNVIVGLVNDETPRMTINRGLRIQSGSTTPIKSSDLRATDIDSDDASIIYTLRKDPTAGHLLYHSKELQYVLSAHSQAKAFTQDSINKGNIFFVHEVGDATGNIIFKFKLSDPEGNELIDQDFFITVLEDHFPPKQVANKEFSITEGKSKKITTDYLSFTDIDSEPGSLQYTVLSGLHLGHLELTSQPGVPVSEFTQADLAANSLLYIHTSPNETYMDRFVFIVSDGSNEIIKTFYINILPVDDSIPLVINRGLKVQEGVRKLITEFDLKAVDYDTKEDKIVFKIVQTPVHGTVDLYSENDVHSPTSAFTMEDIYENRVSYKHDGTENFEDNFSFTVSDGTNNVFVMQQDEPSKMAPITTPQKFEIRILPMDDGMPVLETNLGLQFLEFTGSEVSNLITNRELLASDEDSLAENIIFLVQKAPTHGQVENVANPGRPVRSFSQDDLNNGKIRFVLTAGTDEYQDSFTFDLMDAKPNVVPGNIFHIMWSVVDFEKPQFNVTETAGVIQVPVVRKGNLKQYSIVTCKTVPGFATSKMVGARPGQKDFMVYEAQVQFDDWQESKPCSIIINDDSVFEGPETFYVELSSPTYALLGDKAKTAVTIYDIEDEPVISFKSSVYHVNEGDAYLMAALTRTGDLSSTVSVICFTTSLTATGSSLSGLESGSDYISRGQTNSYRVVFPKGVTEATCDVKLIDDSEYETSEQFDLGLMEPAFPATLGHISKATVILEGPNDESMIFLSLPSYSFEESAGIVEVEILRMGSDLSHSSVVWCATRLSDPPSATPGQDYVPSSSQITFGPGQTTEKCQLTILDDDFDPRREGNETFVVFLSSPMGSTLAEPYFANVIIHDESLDIPRMTFVQEDYIVDEKNKTVNLTIMRTGDVSFESSVICFTRQRTAEVMMDYEERILGDVSRVTFLPGDRLKNCTVRIVDDVQFEPEETFLVRLTQPKGTDECEAELGHMDKTTVTITNHDDVPTIQFAESAYSINEPSEMEQIATMTTKVVRSGDLNTTSSVRCSTRDGSAQSGVDYNPKSLILRFPPGLKEVEFPVDILYNSDVEWHESLTIQLGPEDPEGAIFGPTSSATITILDNEVSGSTILPASPTVVSLLYYDDVEQGVKAKPSPGYPLICVTPCDVHSPIYPKTHSLCEESGINQSRILYHWEVALPADDDESHPPFVQVSDSTLFTSIDKIVLDSIYFRPHFQVRCVAQPLHANGNPGVPLKSKPVTIGNSNSICNSPAFNKNMQGYHAQSFLANLEYVGPDDDDDHPNTIHISVEIPHQDGLLPLISTFPIHNLRLLLSEPIYRQQHVCSNIITALERKPLIDEGFFSGKLSDPLPYGPGFDFPFQFEESVRENRTLALYEHLNLKSCTWRFDAWYHMTELVDICGGRVVSDFQMKDSSRTHLTVKVPLFVSYLYATAPVGWGSLEHRTEMEFSFYYDTMKWRSGLETEGKLGGKLQVLKILIREDGKLVINFRTTAKFRGMYVYEHSTMPGIKSHVVPPEDLAISFDLELVWSQQTFDSPHQMWKATSTFNLKDYTGLYTIELIPCSVKTTQRFINADPIPCTGQPLKSFKVPISFQQTNRPVPVIYSLNTEFQLTNNRKMFLLNPTTDQVTSEDWDFNGAYSEGQTIYGRVLWNQQQDLKEAYKLNIEKVYLCTGANGYIPTFDPTGEVYKEGPQFGCIQPSPKLKHRFLILDYQNSEVTERDFHDIPFDAEFASENPEYSALSDMPGVDGFTMSVDPLYKVDSGHQWYLQVVYIIGPSDKIHERFRRSAVLHVNKRDVSLSQNELRNGTNMISLHLDYTRHQSEERFSLPIMHIVIPIGAGVAVILLIVLIVVFVKRRKRKKEIVTKPNNLVTTTDTCDGNINRWSSRRSLDSKRNTLISVLDNKTNVIKAKDINLMIGNNLDAGTEV
ncbi:extracellular matrix organizing protein FRAS1-like isoform X2 [Gigantopelta aegis]|uniref:extracellular matrix organizing protein FRAS1-like isoform X2 n=1 Tax=Gigantopelta aegis TaxID=1735272 RepID=UPI001B88BA3A|nr:extracellular matrix organizing protein FRAS1-like isoform X2 [Gigantopelta aegis]